MIVSSIEPKSCFTSQYCNSCKKWLAERVGTIALGMVVGITKVEIEEGPTTTILNGFGLWATLLSASLVSILAKIEQLNPCNPKYIYMSSRLN